MLSANTPNPARDKMAEQMAEYERKHGPVKTQPIQNRDNPADQPPNVDRARSRANAKMQARINGSKFA